MHSTAMLISKLPNSITTGDAKYTIQVCGQERADATWEGWIEFHPTDSNRPILTTEQETSQPNRRALEYWADGLKPIYLEGAFARAQGRLM